MLQRNLKDAGIGTQIHYPVPPHLSGAYADMGFKPGTFPVAETLAKEVLSLPLGPQVNAEQAQAVGEAVRSAVERLEPVTH
jgi:dTDP-4-amino-4,6-dideoxygalactose transaminase